MSVNFNYRAQRGVDRKPKIMWIHNAWNCVHFLGLKQNMIFKF